MESCKLPDVPLFRGLTETEAAAAIEALRMRRRPFAKGEVLLEAGCTAPPLGVVLAGRVHMEHLDVRPGRAICLPRLTPACPRNRCWSAWWQPKAARCCFWTPINYCGAAANRGAGR